MEIKIYTDGACVGNPGPGGWAAIILLENEKHVVSSNEEQLYRGTQLLLDYMPRERYLLDRLKYVEK